MAPETLYPTCVRFDFMKLVSLRSNNMAMDELKEPADIEHNDDDRDEWWNWDKEE